MAIMNWYNDIEASIANTDPMKLAMLFSVTPLEHRSRRNRVSPLIPICGLKMSRQ